MTFQTITVEFTFNKESQESQDPGVVEVTSSTPDAAPTLADFKNAINEFLKYKQQDLKFVQLVDQAAAATAATAAAGGTTSSAGDPSEGLAPIHINREETIANLIKVAEKNRRILIVAPPFSGKTATAQLLEAHLSKGQNVRYISFKALVGPVPTWDELKEHVSITTNMSWQSFASGFVCNQSNIVITDESQAAFHESFREFWRLFKYPGCILIAFASVATPSGSPLSDYITPAEFHKPPFGFDDIALSETEYYELASKFGITNEISLDVGKSICSICVSKLTRQVTKVFHAGLAQACFQKISELLTNKSNQEVLALIQNRGFLYRKAKELGGERCFPSLLGYHTFFDQTVAKYNSKQQFRISPEVVAKASGEFPYRFQNLLIRLITHNLITYEYDPANWLSLVEYEILTRAAVACVAYDKDAIPRAWLSCKLLKEHFLAEMRREYANLIPLKSLHIENAESYALDIISKFDPSRLTFNYLTSPTNGVIYESSFQFEFCHVANLFGTEAVCPEFRFLSTESNKEIGRIDCVVTAGKHTFGIEFLRMSDRLDSHLERPYEVTDNCVIDFYENQCPAPTKYTKLVNLKEDPSYFDKTLMVVLIKSQDGVYESVKFYKYNSQSEQFVHLVGRDAHLISTRQQFKQN